MTLGELCEHRDSIISFIEAMAPGARERPGFIERRDTSFGGKREAAIEMGANPDSVDFLVGVIIECETWVAGIQRALSEGEITGQRFTVVFLAHMSMMQLAYERLIEIREAEEFMDAEREADAPNS